MLRRISEASADQSALGPLIVDASQMPVNSLGRGVLIKLVANINQLLDARNIDIVNATYVLLEKAQVFANRGG